MNANQLTQKSIEAIQAAQRMAQERNHTQIQQARLMAGLPLDDPAAFSELVCKLM